MPILRILCYNGSLVTWTVISLTAASSYISMSGFALSYVASMFILMILYDTDLSSLYHLGTDLVENTVPVAVQLLRLCLFGWQHDRYWAAA
jgi:hypothetical protein